MFSLQTTYTQARENLAKLLDQIENDNTIAIIKRRGHKDIAMLTADELTSVAKGNSCIQNLHFLVASLLRRSSSLPRRFAPASLQFTSSLRCVSPTKLFIGKAWRVFALADYFCHSALAYLKAN